MSWIRLVAVLVAMPLLISGCPQSNPDDSSDGGQGGSGGSDAGDDNGSAGDNNDAGGAGEQSDDCNDERFGFAAQLSGAGTGRTFFSQFPSGCREFFLDINNVPAGAYSVSVAGVVVDTVTIGLNGSTVIDYSTPGLPFPENFPDLAVGDEVGLIGGPMGTLAAQCPPEEAVCQEGFIRQ